MTDTERSPAVPHSASHPDHGLSAAQVAAGQVNTRHFGSVTMPGHLHSEGASAGIGAFDAGNRHGRSRPGEVSPRAFIVAQMTVERPAEPKGGVAPGTMHGINRGLEGSNPRGRTLKAEVHQSAWADEPRKRCHRRIVSVEVDPGVGPLDGFSHRGRYRVHFAKSVQMITEQVRHHNIRRTDGLNHQRDRGFVHFEQTDCRIAPQRTANTSSRDQRTNLDNSRDSLRHKG